MPKVGITLPVSMFSQPVVVTRSRCLLVIGDQSPRILLGFAVADFSEDKGRRWLSTRTNKAGTVVEEFVRYDEARPAATLPGRDAVFVAASRLSPPLPGGLLVDDTTTRTLS